MATFARSTTQTSGRSRGLAAGLRGFSDHLQAYRAEARERSRIVRELSTYSDNELCELGLSRCDIPAVAAGTFRR